MREGVPEDIWYQKAIQKKDNADAPNIREYHGPHLKRTAAADCGI